MRKIFLFCILIFYLNLHSQQVIKLFNWDSNITIKGQSYFDNFSSKIASGDINNDGYQDLIISSPNADPLERNSAGIIYIFLGKTYTIQQTEIDLSNQNADITILGAQPNDKIGTSLFCEDINNDGFDDIIIGAPHSKVNDNNETGKIYIFLGNANLNSTYDLSSSANYFCTIEGNAPNQNFGTAIEICNFTFNNKWLFVSAPYSTYQNIEGCGIIYCFNLSQIHSGSIDIDTAIKITGENINENIGISLSSGNFNNDEFEDILIGAPNSDYQTYSNCGKIFVLNGQYSLNQSTYNINSQLLQTVIIGPNSNSRIGNILHLKDINQDNKDDIFFFDNSNNSIDIIFGSSNLPEEIQLQNYTLNIKIFSNENYHLNNLFFIADVNNDNKNDILIQLEKYNSSLPTNELLNCIYGQSNLQGEINLDNYTFDKIIYAQNFNETFATALSVSDINNDGLNDITISSPNWQNEKGKTYTIFGGLPYISNKNPDENQNDVPINTNVTFELFDDEEGIDINSIAVSIAGISYTSSDSNFIYSGNPNDYFIVINPSQNFGFNQTIDVSVFAKDLANWELPEEIYAFTTINDIYPPFTANWDPAPDQTGVSVDTDVSFNIYDNGCGVDINSLNVDINNTIYNVINGNLSFSGSSDNYHIVITPNQHFNYGQLVSVTISASDLSSPPNTMEPFSYNFITNQDTIKPRIKSYYPQNEQEVAFNSDIEVILVDNETGINTNQLALILDNTENLIQNCSITPQDSIVTIKYSPTVDNYYSYGLHTIRISFQDNAEPPNSDQFNWSFICIDDTQPPIIEEVFPPTYSIDNPTNTPFYVKITDNLTGVNLNSINISINSTDIINSPYTQITNISNGYLITYNNPERFLGTNNVIISCSDNDIPPNYLEPYSYYFICSIDTIAPHIENLNPAEAQTNVPINSTISLDIIDDKTGIDFSSIHLQINENDVTSQTQITQINPHKASIIYNPQESFTFEDTINVNISCFDLAITPNLLNTSYYFIIEKDMDPPYVANEQPANGSSGIPVDTDINFDLLDDGLGVNLSSINISFYVNNHVPVVIYPEISEIENGYHIYFHPDTSFTYQDTVNLIISAEDNSTPPNTLNAFRYYFICEDDDSEPPFLNAQNPAEFSQNNPINTSISFEILDKNSGVDLNSIIIKIDHSSLNQFNYEEVSHGDSIGYYIYYQPEEPFQYNQTVYVDVFAIDLSSNHNILNHSYYFTTENDTIPPQIVSYYPNPTSSGYCNSPIYIKFYDAQSGINPNSFILKLDNIPIPSYVDSIFEDYYSILYTHSSLFEENTNKTIFFHIEDNIGNFNDSTYTIFISADSFPPYLKIIKPLNNSISINDTLIFDLLDKGTGVEKTSIKIQINNKLLENYNILDNPYSFNPDSLGYRILYQIKNKTYYEGQILHLKTSFSDFSSNSSNIEKDLTISISDKTSLNIIPKTITPNNDGWNDECRIILKSNSVAKTGYIYSIDGTLINKVKFQKIKNDLFETIWNGKYSNGKYVSSGIYIVKVKANSKYLQGVIVVAH